MMARPLPLKYWCNAAAFAILFLTLAAVRSQAHEGQHDRRSRGSQQRKDEAPARGEITEAKHYFRLFTKIVAGWPTTLNPELIQQAYREHQFIHGDPQAAQPKRLWDLRQQMMNQLTSMLPIATIEFSEHGATLKDFSQPLQLCRGMRTPLLCQLINRTDQELAVQIHSDQPQVVAASSLPNGFAIVVDHSSTWLLCPIEIKSDSDELDRIAFRVEFPHDAPVRFSLPIELAEPANLDVTLEENGEVVPGRVTVQCSDGVCRLAGDYANNSTLIEKPIIYPPIGTSQKLPFVYSDGRFTISVPPGKTVVTMEHGFEHHRSVVAATVRPGESRDVKLSCDRIIDMAASGWISGDTHVHWVTNAWNVDQPLELLSKIQRAEDLRVANNLTLLQRYADQAFIKPSQAAMGPVPEFSNSQFHVQMGEEYRNEDLYGHLCFLNIDWLVQPIGTGSIIAGPDALDYPINRTAIDACRQQGGISIEAHGTGGNKDVPVNVIHRLSDSLDQMEPELYYRLLDCGFRIPLTNGSDHPARPLGIARCYVKVDGEFTYDRWIEGIRDGRTFTTSGPLISLNVNEAEIGDVIHAGATQELKVTARVVSRDPIGTFQVISNGEVIAEKQVESTSAELQLEIPAQESRWIVARCSNRTDGRAEFGFGNFNAITGTGVAHTSPVYVQVDRFPRFDPDAARYWLRRMRDHANGIRVRGRFASESQRNEAVGYIDRGIKMFGQLPDHLQAARASDEDWRDAKNRLANIVRRFGDPQSVAPVLDSLVSSQTLGQLRTAVKPLVLLSASLNPESRVKISTTQNHIELRTGRPQRFLVSVENAAGSTAPLQIEAFDVASHPPTKATWCDVEIVDSPFTSVFLTGAKREYKVVEVLVRESGLKEVRLSANVGQGTQDLGFRATADLLIDTKSSVTGKED